MSTREHVNRLLKLVSKHFKMSKTEILEHTRSQRNLRARAAAVKLIRDTLKLSYPKLGLIFNQNHATMINAYNNANMWLSEDRCFRDAYINVEADLRG